MKRIFVIFAVIFVFYPNFAFATHCQEASLDEAIQSLQQEANTSSKNRESAMQTLSEQSKGYPTVSNSDARAKLKSFAQGEWDSKSPNEKLTPRETRQKIWKLKQYFSQIRQTLDLKLQAQLVGSGKYSEYLAYSAELAKWEAEADRTLSGEIEKFCDELQGSEPLKKVWMTAASKEFYEELKALHNAGTPTEQEDGSVASRKLSSE